MKASRVLVALSLALAAAGCGLGSNGSPQSALLAPSSSGTGIESQSVQNALQALDTDQVTNHPIPEPGTSGDGFDTPPDGSVQADGLWPTPPPGDLANFGEINGHLFRGARPTDNGFAQLKAKGVTTVIDLENGAGEIQWEQKEVESHGMTFISLPLGVVLPPSLAKVDYFFKTVNAPGTVAYFHCMQGRDRTGVMAFCYRIKFDGWTTSQAYAEMKQYGFHTFLLGLNAFVHWYGMEYAQPATASVAT